jgi:hypothetical protein
MNPAEQAFETYKAAKLKVDQTLSMHDAMIAGRAWAAFLNLFLEEDQQLPTSDVVPFPKRRAS